MMALVFFMKGKKYDICESGMDYNLNLKWISRGTGYGMDKMHTENCL